MNAKDHLEKAIALNPEFSPAYYNLGLLLKANSDFAGALKNFHKAVSLDTEFAEAECELAIVPTTPSASQFKTSSFGIV